jgi:L-alanine-DL-glutamate epimerase-like enolase superfamily enzyme
MVIGFLERRTIVAGIAATLAASALPAPAFGARRRPELRITRIIVQDAPGRRPTPVAPNAYAEYRGFDVVEPILRIQTAQGLEGICHAPKVEPATLRQLIGRDPFALFAWDDDRIAGVAPEYQALVAALGSVDNALIDLMARALKRPVSALLGPAVRSEILIYDSSVYMEDLLSAQQLEGVAYLEGKSPPSDPVALPALKAAWVLRNRPEGFRALKIKIGRSRWMSSPEAAIQRDIEVTHAIRAAIGPDIRFMADGNKDYGPRPEKAFDYARAVESTNLFMLEEMFPEVQIEAMEDFRRKLRASGNPVKLAAGESYPDGIPEQVYTQRLVSGAGASEPLLDIDQADMNATGYLRIRAKAAVERPLGMTFAPHNFASKMGFYTMAHLAMATPNWAMCEVDDSVYPALRADGFELSRGVARLTGRPGLGVTLDEKFLNKPTLDLS